MIFARSGSDAQEDLFEVDATRGVPDALLADSYLYHTSADYKALLDFVVRLRNFAPFNAMLLRVQRPGLTYAASGADWRTRFGRKPEEGTRTQNSTVGDLDIYQVTRAAGQVETLLGLGVQARFSNSRSLAR
jgi:hypothetical protein